MARDAEKSIRSVVGSNKKSRKAVQQAHSVKFEIRKFGVNQKKGALYAIEKPKLKIN